MIGTLCALGAIALWATLASLGVALAHVPPFLLTGLALVVGSAPSWPLVRQWRVPASTLLLGIYGLFGYHFLLFVALRTAPPLEANLVNYLWPLLIVVLAPVFLRGIALAAGARRSRRSPASPARRWRSSAVATSSGGLVWGYLAAAGAAFIWASYSLLTQRVAHFPTAAIGLFGLVSGLLALACHALLEPAVALSTRDWLLIGVIGLGPLGAAFFLWDAALKRSDPRRDRPAQLPDAARVDAAAGG